MSDPIYASMATYPPRYDAAFKVVKRLAPNVDAMRLYVNDMHEGEHVAPPWLRDLPTHVHVVLGSQASGDLSDAGKFYGVEHLPRKCYHLTVDDDIAYPDDYVRRLVRGIDRHQRRKVCGFHGCLLPDEQVDSYYHGGQREKVHFRQRLKEDRPVHLLGTGVCGYHTQALDLKLTRDFHAQHMADIFLAIACQRQRVGMVCLGKPNDWLRPYRTTDAGIYHTYSTDDAYQTTLINAHTFRTH